MMNQMKGLMGGKADELAMMAESMDAGSMDSAMAELDQNAGSLGPNPFAGSASNPLGGMGAGLGGLGGGLPGLGSGMGAPQTRGGTKKNRKKKKR